MTRFRSAKRRDRPHLAPVLGARAKRLLRNVLRLRDGADCFYCLEPMGADETLEHLEDWSAGGSNDPANTALCHERCNYAVKDLTVNQKMLVRGDALLSAMAMQRVAA